jgi:hypothetical protein
MQHADQIGLTRRELERELAWLMKQRPADPEQLVKLLCQSFVSLIEKNNHAIARALEQRDDQAAGTTAPHQETKA